MSKLSYIAINGNSLPIGKEGTYSVAYEDYEIVNQTEAGTYTRELIREGIPTISCNMLVTDAWAAILRTYKSLASVAVTYREVGMATLANRTMFVTGFNAERKTEVHGTVLWVIDMTLHSF